MTCGGRPFLLLAPLICLCEAHLFVPAKIQLAVGEPFRYVFGHTNHKIIVKDASGEDLPSWLFWDGGRTLIGVPELSSVGSTYLRVTEYRGADTVLEIQVREELSNPCGDHQNTLWMELVFDGDLHKMNTTMRMNIVDLTAQYFEVNKTLLRVYSNSYKESIRRSETVQSELEEHGIGAQTATVIWKIACGDLDEEVAETLEKAVSMDEMQLEGNEKPKVVGWKLSKGSILSRRQRHQGGSGSVLSHFSAFATYEPDISLDQQSVTSAATTSTRFTRSTIRVDNPPVRLNSLPTFHCLRGAVCELSIPPTTFLDAEDGNTTSLSLSVSPIGGERNWLNVSSDRRKLQGILLNQGDLEFRLDARDRANQMISAPFRVKVEEPAPYNHLFIFKMQRRFESFMSKTETLSKFMDKLAKALGDRTPKNIVIRNVGKHQLEYTIISWSNSSLGHKACQKKALNAVKNIMVYPKKESVRHDFLRALGSEFLIDKVELQFRENCISTTLQTVVETSTATAPSPGSSLDMSASSLWLPALLAVTLLLVLIVIVIITCCVLKRRSSKTAQSEYISKGLPVVFPEEIPQEDESANVSTPMLVKEERPPLVVSLHENPLYKPPPPLSSTSSPRPRSAATNQRLPPPYVPP